MPAARVTLLACTQPGRRACAHCMHGASGLGVLCVVLVAFEIGNFQFGGEKYPNWKSEMFNLMKRNIQIGNQFIDEKYVSWKLIMRKIQFGNGKTANWKSVIRNFQIGRRNS